MADWYGTSRSNYVKVKDVEKATAALEAAGEVHTMDKDGTTWVMVSGDDDGDFNTFYTDENDCEREFSFSEWATEHLAEGQVLVLISAGAEKLRYVSGWAEAHTWDGHEVEVNLMRELNKKLQGIGIASNHWALPEYQDTSEGVVK